MRFFHTLWTAPLKPKHIAPTVANFTLSATFIKNIPDAEIVLHTDDFGYRLLNHIKYDKIYVDLNSIDSNIGNYFWAYGKLFATKKEPIGSIHIDGDVFLQNIQLSKAFDETVDIVVQSTEDDSTKKDDCYLLTQNVYEHFEVPSKMDIRWPYAYNCGVVQINNQELKKTYLNTYFKAVKNGIKDGDLPNYIIYENLKGSGKVIMDIVAEQQFLHQICTENDYKVRRILYKDDLNIQANEIGYCHLCGPEKYNQFETVNQTLHNMNYEQYYLMHGKDLFIQYEKRMK